MSPIKYAIIYCRVSSEKQVKEGSGLESQEKRCIDYAKSKGYPIAEIFHDEGISGAKLDRPGVQRMIAYIDKNPLKEFIVIFDDLSRVARDVVVYVELKASLTKRNVALESPNFIFDDSAEGVLYENITMAVAQYGRQSNRRQVIQKMKARLESGYWSFQPPSGYKTEKISGAGKVLKPVQPYGEIYKEAIEMYSLDSLNTLEEVRSYINSRFASLQIKRRISLSAVREILSKPLYAGYLEYKPWGVPFMKAKHSGIINLETYKAVQNKLLGKAKPRLRKDYSVDFPLRGFVLCDECHQPLTASWNKGRSKKYPNYWCKNKNCNLKNKTIAKDHIEEDFIQLLKTVQPDESLLLLLKEIFNDAWNDNKTNHAHYCDIQNEKMNTLKSKIDTYIDLIVKTSNEILRTQYENKVIELEKELQRINTKAQPQKYSQEEFETASEIVFNTLRNPVMMWRQENIESQRSIIYMFFNEKIKYDRKKGFGTATLTLPVKLSQQNNISKSNIVEMPGIEPGSE